MTRGELRDWRQGSVLNRSDLDSLYEECLCPGDHEWYLVVSHDCDLTASNAVENCVELIPATTVSAIDQNVTYGKHPRRLQIACSDEMTLEVCIGNRFQVPKSTVLDVQPVSLTLPPENLRSLQSWLAKRYRRHALPDALTDRLRPFLGKLGRKLKTNVSEVIGVWISYDPLGEAESAEPCEIWLTIVYPHDVPGAGDKAGTLEEWTCEQFQHADQAEDTGVYLGACRSVSDQQFTLYDLRQLAELNFDYLSNREFPDGVEYV